MNEKYKKRVPKFLPVGIAMGVLFSASPLAAPLTENKVKADVDTFGTIVTTFGEIYDAFLAEPFAKWLEEIDVKTTYKAFNENIAYKAPTFQKGEFGISAFDYYKNKDFSKKVKIAYANGKVEYKTIKHGEQIRIKDAGTIVDLTPDEPELSKHDILYISQKQLDAGNTGVSLTNFKTYYLQSDNSGRKNELAYKFLQKTFPNAYHNGIPDWGVNQDELFKKLPEEKRILGTITSEPVSKEKIFSLTESDIDNMNYRMDDILTQHKEGQYSSISLKIKTGDSFLRSWEDGRLSKSVGEVPLGRENFKIIPIKKGSNKVILKENLQYIPSALGTQERYKIGPDKVWTLHNTGQNGVFVLQNDKGQYLSVDDSSAKFTDQYNEASFFNADLNRDEWNNWLIDWYPGKENERKKYDINTYEIDEKDPNKRTAKDSHGNVIKNNWVKKGDDQYYAGSDGVFLKDWQEINGKKYYFNPQGFNLVTTNGTEIGGKYYYFNDDGSVKQSTWTEDHYGLHYSDASGTLIEKGLQEIDGKIYYFQNGNANKKEIRLEDQNIILHFSDKGALEKASKLDGKALSDTGTYVTFDEKKLAFEKDGSIRKNGVSKIFMPDAVYTKEIPVIVYYSLEEGPFYTGFKEIDGKKYYFESGKNYNFDAHQTIGGKKYYFNHEGQALLTGFVDINGKTFYMNDKGEMVTGFYDVDGKRYYFQLEDAYGSYYKRGEPLKNGFHLIDGKRYAFSPDGVLYQNFKGYINNHRFGQRYIETNNEGIVTHS
ncbi:cell wall-binding protein [Bacillus toyonensis]|uniref:cell wall-binding protein n=1 Tax=Bacillus toyonensis TaxID=155322 RepID=UPI000BFD346D|nr:cell wall-binding protein [Bacillus toyonensis]PHF20566.1 cell wall-binding protein [Bacillus toyonensis]